MLDLPTVECRKVAGMEEETDMQTFKVDGITCGHCERAVTAAVQGVDPQASVQVSLASGAVSTDSELPAADLVEAIRGAGYEVAPGKLPPL